MSRQLHQGRTYQVYDVSSRGKHVKTFQGRKYEVRGLWAVDEASGEHELIANIYGDIRTVKDDQFYTIAKRKSNSNALRTRYK